MKYESKTYKVFMFFNVIFMILAASACIFPYLHVLAKSLNDSKDTMLGGLTIFPRVPTLANFEMIISNPDIFQAAGLTLIIVITSTILRLFVDFSVAFALRRTDLLGRSGILIYLMIPMFISGGLIPTYLLYSNMGLLNNILVYILPNLFSFYNMIIIRTYMNSSIPMSLEEAAKIDGANEVRVFFGIILPLCKPILATIGLWVAVAAWNDWTTTLYFITKPKLYSLQYLLMQLVKESERIMKMIETAIQSGESVEQLQKMSQVTPESIVSAQIIFTTIPIVLVYPFLQKYFVQGVMLGSVKE